MATLRATSNDEVQSSSASSSSAEHSTVETVSAEDFEKLTDEVHEGFVAVNTSNLLLVVAMFMSVGVMAVRTLLRSFEL